MKSITVESLAEQFGLEILTGADCLGREITQGRTHRPGLEFIGYFDYFPMEQIQILGKKEITYLHQLGEDERQIRIGNVVKYHPPCFIVTGGQEGLQYLMKYCTEEGIPLLRTAEKTTEFIDKLNAYLTSVLAPEMTIHGVCMNIFGVGVLIRGKSGAGKSETAHTLIGRGHRLIADDLVVLKKISSQTILGTHNIVNKEFLALRSIGLLNVVRVYGRKAFQEETRIALDIELTKWEDQELNNDIIIEQKSSEYLGVKIPHVEIQLQPGRDIAGLIEAAANNWYLMQQGYSAADEFFSRIQELNGRKTNEFRMK
ncbi:HPr(Ser) kinase/phosphatase [Bacillus kwashiorkori]|uniref:HPr(Ser) kinase/phosphatase n=1 Tax=Bacillus kwashiorkori TaxID=1522318 RepID=UPI0007860236|nr:HPr(Ser) kinase/phosphatase [Bacillus kwashiorkori]